ncbi:MAG TPA: Ig-like domain-containing protein [Patescibacteria group bacterium]|nr:Ig-like domain-containing protein [Patescibacteria group bacterium]
MTLDKIWDLLLQISLPFETRLIILLTLVGTVIAANALHWIIKRRPSWFGITHRLKELQNWRFNLPQNRVLRDLDIAWRRTLLAEFRFLRHGNFIPYSIFALITAGALIMSTFLSRPFIVAASPADGAYMASAEEPISVEFSLPIDEEIVKLYVSPEVMGYWDFEKTIFNLPLKWKAKFHPDESFYPGQKIVVYATGLRARWGKEELHEQAVEMFAPKIPQITSTSPVNEAEDVGTNTGIEIVYDAPLGKFIETSFRISPSAEFLVEEETDRQFLIFKEPLEQDRLYTIDVYQTPRSYRLLDNESVTAGETKLVGSFGFRTVATPLISSYTPKGTGALPTTPLTIYFSEEMDQARVEENFHLTPQTPGKISWADGKTFVFNPDSPWKKETKYEVAFSPGISSLIGGVTEEEVKLNFETIGRVRVLSLSPASGMSGLDPIRTNVVVEFDQKVDHASAQQRFSIRPSESGTFSWSGNRMTYAVAGKLNYSTTYEITISPGVKTVAGSDSTAKFQSSFTTRSKTFVLNIPQYYQDPRTETFNCNLVALQMALAYRGISVTQEQVKAGLGTGQNPNADWVGGYGTHTAPVAAYLQSKGVNFAVKTGWNVSGIAKEIEKGNPVILWWYNRYSTPKGTKTLPGGYTGYNGMHSEVVRGFVGSSNNPSYLLTNDPWRGQLTYSQSLFKSTWAYMNYTAIVVYR